MQQLGFISTHTELITHIFFLTPFPVSTNQFNFAQLRLDDGGQIWIWKQY
jgi:hypothetical protein